MKYQPTHHRPQRPPACHCQYWSFHAGSSLSKYRPNHSLGSKLLHRFDQGTSSQMHSSRSLFHSYSYQHPPPGLPACRISIKTWSLYNLPVFPSCLIMWFVYTLGSIRSIDCIACPHLPYWLLRYKKIILRRTYCQNRLNLCTMSSRASFPW